MGVKLHIDRKWLTEDWGKIVINPFSLLFEKFRCFCHSRFKIFLFFCDKWSVGFELSWITIFFNHFVFMLLFFLAEPYSNEQIRWSWNGIECNVWTRRMYYANGADGWRLAYQSSFLLRIKHAGFRAESGLLHKSWFGICLKGDLNCYLIRKC